MATNATAIPGAKFGKLEVVSTNWRTVDQPCGRKQRREAYCKCECGNTCKTLVCRLGKSAQSCGCLKKSSGGISKTRHYRIASGARARCRNPKNESYPYYGGRGITFNFGTVREAAAYIAMLPDADDPALSLDRKDVDGPYAIGNLRWATAAEQAANKRTSEPQEDF